MPLASASPTEASWTGGQYSVFRVLFGAYLFVHFAQLLPWGGELFSSQGMLPDGSLSPLLYLFPNVLAVADSPVAVNVLITLAAALSIPFAIGYRDRLCAVLLWYMWACLFGRNPLIANPSLPYVGVLLLAHALLPSAPYGSFAGRGRPDPRGTWRMRGDIYVVVWALMALGYTYSGVTKLVSPSWIDGSALQRVLENPLARPTAIRDLLSSLPSELLRLATWGALGAELLFAPLSLVRQIRKWLWLIMLLMHLGLITLIDFADLSLGMVMLHLFTLNPKWIARADAMHTETIFYDGQCGLCHRAVRFVLAEDQRGDTFRFAPLGGEAFNETLPTTEANALPDSIVVVRADGRVLVRSEAVLHIMRRLGGLWRALALLAAVVPRALRDLAYDGIATIRHRLFSKPADVCPMIPKELRTRFRTSKST